jgi:hypothetical protein
MSDPGTTYRSREEIQRMRSTHDPILEENAGSVIGDGHLLSLGDLGVDVGTGGLVETLATDPSF